MTGKELIKIIQDNNLEDFSIKMHTTTVDPVWGSNLEIFELGELDNINCSSKEFIFSLI